MQVLKNLIKTIGISIPVLVFLMVVLLVCRYFNNLILLQSITLIVTIVLFIVGIYLIRSNRIIFGAGVVLGSLMFTIIWAYILYSLLTHGW